MAEGERTIDINGYKWRASFGSRESYDRRDIERLAGDPERVKREAPTFDGKTYTMSNSQ